MLLALPLFLGWLLSLQLSVFSYFRFLFVLPVFYLLATVGVVTVTRKVVRIGLLGAMVIVNLVCSGIYLFNSRYWREDWRGAVGYIEEKSMDERAEAIFVTRNQRDAYIYYAKQVPAYGPEGLEMGPYDKLWLVRYVQPIFDPQDTLRWRIEELGYKKQKELDFNGVGVWEYIKSGEDLK